MDFSIFFDNFFNQRAIHILCDTFVGLIFQYLTSENINLGGIYNASTELREKFTHPPTNPHKHTNIQNNPVT